MKGKSGGFTLDKNPLSKKSEGFGAKLKLFRSKPEASETPVSSVHQAPSQGQTPASKLPVRQCIQDYVDNKEMKPTKTFLSIENHCHTASQIQEDPELNNILSQPTVKDLYKDKPLELLDASNYVMARLSGGENIRIGKGSYGELILARDETTKEMVAVKMSNASLEDMIKEFGYQTKAHKILGKFAPSFKGLLQVRKDSRHGVSSGFRYLPVMEFCSLADDAPVAMTLDDALSLYEKGHNFFSKHEWFQICIQILRAVNHLSSSGLHHCDLKDDNILLRFEGDSVYPVIIDYGQAKEGIVYNEKKTLHPRVSEEYMRKYHPHVPPEMFTQNYLLPTSDLYSAAFCILLINEVVFRSKKVQKEMEAYRKMSAQKRHGYTHLKSTVVQLLSACL